MRWPIVLALLLATRVAGAQDVPAEKEMVYIMADSSQWVLAYHTLPESRTIACEVATRAQPGAVFRQFFQNQRTFTVYLMASPAPVDSFVRQVDENKPAVRTPTPEERRNNVLHVRGSQLGGHIDRLVGASRLRVQVFYPGREKQDLEIDLTGFTPLYWRAVQLDCVPPQVNEERCQYLQEILSGNSSALPVICRRSLESKKEVSGRTCDV